MASILSGLPPQVSAKLVSEGLVAWYKNELDMLKATDRMARVRPIWTGVHGSWPITAC